ncbi:MAG TPA: ATP-binding protein [Myxococcota bacterium]|nr:ATP-binding protein [Myxococcota bacterium]
MSPAILATLAIAVVALYSAALHGWLHVVHRRGTLHLWHALTTLAVCGLTTCTALLYGADTLEEAKRWQNAQMMFSAPLIVGFFHFTWEFLGISRKRLLWPLYAFSASVFVSAGATDWIFDQRTIRTRIPAIGLDYLRAPATPFGGALMIAFGAALLGMIVLFARHARRDDPDVRTLAATTSVMCVAGLVDLGLTFDWYRLPMLMPFGYLAIVVGFSGLLVRRFVQSMEYSEALAENLHELVERRTAELRQKDLQLAHGERMAVVGTLAAGVAHEINNPMAFLSSNLNRLEELWRKPEDGGEAEALEILGECQEGAHRVRATVTELLSLARRDDSSREPVDLAEVVGAVLRMARYEARDRAVLVRDLSTCRAFPGDRRLVGQVVLNLVMNGLQAIAPGRPERNRVVVRTRDLGDRVRLQVEDSGSGIPDGFRDEIFDPFFTTKEPGEGTGLGLAVTRKIVREHHGEIRVESSRQGTCMTVDFFVERLGEATDPGGG